MSLIKKKIHQICFLENGGIKKNDTLLLTILFAWFMSIIYFNPMLFSLLIGDEPLIAKIAVIIFVIVLNMMWLYGIYHSVNILFACFIKINLPEKILFESENPAVALLYMTKNDFDQNACLTAVNQKYDNFHVFICDDSDSQEIKNKISSFIMFFFHII